MYCGRSKMSRKTSAEELLRRYDMESHVENGSFLERHYVSDEPGRPASGSIYYYVSPDEVTKFHRIDCDEYWCFAAGSPLELCQISPDGEVSFSMLGVEDGCDPLIYFKKGVCFASRHPQREQEGTFLCCITVPRFSPEGFTLCSDEEILRDHPELESFFRLP